MIAPVSARWAALVQGPQAWAMSFLVSRSSNRTSDDYLADAVMALNDEESVGPGVEVLSVDATKGQLASLRIRFTAPDEEAARKAAQHAYKAAERYSQFVDALKVVPARMTAMERGGR